MTSEWQNMDMAPVGVWVLVSWDAPIKRGELYGPWDYGMDKFDVPPPPAMVAISIPGDFCPWRAYSDDCGHYGGIDTPTKWKPL